MAGRFRGGLCAERVFGRAGLLGYHFDKGIHNFGIELGAAAFLYDRDCTIDGHPFPVGAVRGDGVKDIGYCKNPRPNADSLPGKACRIPVSVEAFMMVKDDGDRRCKVVDRFQDACPFRLGARI